MQAIDKFGNEIYPSVFKKIQHFGRILSKRYSYRESYKKPNLFYRNFEDKVIFLADMRGTELVPIWQEPNPLFYVKFLNKGQLPEWKRNRIVQKEFERLSFCRESYDPDFSDYDLHGRNGYCCVCGKDMQRSGDYCSKLCEKVMEDLWLGKAEKCQVCGEYFHPADVVRHHISYEEDKTIKVCRSCHIRIHRGKMLPVLKPVDSKVKPTKSKKTPTLERLLAGSLSPKKRFQEQKRLSPEESAALKTEKEEQRDLARDRISKMPWPPGNS